MVLNDDSFTLRRHELARRLNLLLAALVSPSGQPYGYQEIADAVAAQGVSLTRKRWNYMLTGEGPIVTNTQLLTAICDFFGVNAEYLTIWGSEGTPADIETQLEFIRAIRINGITEIAARSLNGEISSQGLQRLTEILHQFRDTSSSE